MFWKIPSLQEWSGTARAAQGTGGVPIPQKGAQVPLLHQAWLMGGVWSEVQLDGPGVLSQPFYGPQREKSHSTLYLEFSACSQDPRQAPGASQRTKAGLNRHTASPVCSVTRAQQGTEV